MDTIIFSKHFLTMEGEGVGYRGPGALLLKNGEIVDLVTEEEGRSIEAGEVIELKHHVVLPGFIDAHMHTGLAILRGVAQDSDSWMMGALAPFEYALTKKQRLVGSRLGYLEGIKNGTTLFGDYEVYGDELCRMIEKIGVRGNITQFVRSAKKRAYSPGELYDFDEEEGEASLRSNLDLFDTYHKQGESRIRVLIGPQGADFVHEDLLLECREEAIERDTKIHLHLQQGDRETYQIMKRYGMRPVEYLDRLGYLDEYLLGVHLTDCTEEEAALVAKRGASMLFCPGSIGIIDGIVPPVLAFLEAGGKVALGSDQASGNNCHNIFNEMKLTCLFSKIERTDPEVMPAWKALRLGTVEGARALGYDNLGTLEPGMKADLIAVNLRTPAMEPVMTYPMRTIVPNLVYAAKGSEVDLTMVEGRVLYDGKKVLTMDEEEIYEEVEREIEKIGKAAEKAFLATEGVNRRFMEEGKL